VAGTRTTARSRRRAPDVPIDLRDPGEVPWAALEVPEGWRAVARVTEQVAADLDGLVTRVVVAIDEEVAAYDGGLVPADDVAASVRRSMSAILVGLAEHRGPTREELLVRRELGARRALQGVPLDALIEAFHIGYRELWLALVAAVPDDDPDASLQLLTAATTVWQWVHAISEALSTAHAATVRSLEARAIGSRQRFVELVVSGDLDGSEAARLGTQLGFDPGGRFVVTAVRGASDDLDAVELQRVVAELPGTHAAVARGPLLLVITQEAPAHADGGQTPSGIPGPSAGSGPHGEDPAAPDRSDAADRPAAGRGTGDGDGDGDGDGEVSVVARVAAAGRALVPEAGIGIGAARAGLHGARASLQDAEGALAVTHGAVTTRFDDVWLWATLTRSGERLGPVLAPGLEVAASNPHLAEAVHAFAEAGFSLSEASRRLALHANTVAYRLDRWEELTGWDPKTFSGLVRSVASLRIPPR
jgi:hypothetical protein